MTTATVHRRSLKAIWAALLASHQDLHAMRENLCKIAIVSVAHMTYWDIVLIFSWNHALFNKHTGNARTICENNLKWKINLSSFFSLQLQYELATCISCRCGTLISYRAACAGHFYSIQLIIELLLKSCVSLRTCVSESMLKRPSRDNYIFKLYLCLVREV